MGRATARARGCNERFAAHGDEVCALLWQGKAVHSCEAGVAVAHTGAQPTGTKSAPAAWRRAAPAGIAIWASKPRVLCPVRRNPRGRSPR